MKSLFSAILRSPRLFGLFLITITLCAAAYAGQGVDPSNQQSVDVKTNWIDSQGNPQQQLTIVECTPVTLSANVNEGKTPIAGTVTFAYNKPATSAQKTPGSGDKTTSTQVTVTIDTTGNGKSTVSGLSPGDYSFTYTGFAGTNTSYQVSAPPSPLQLTVQKTATPLDKCPYRMPPLMSTIVGLDVEGASSTSPAARFLGNVTVDLPIFPTKTGPNRMTNIEEAKVFLTGSLRIAAMAQPGALSSSALTEGYLASAVNASPDKIVQSWEGVGSLSYKLFSTNLGFGTFDEGSPTSPDYPRKTLFTTSLLISGGFISPLSASQANPPVYYVTTQIINDVASGILPPPNTQFAATCSSYASSTPPGTPACYVAFVPTDRMRFYRHYEAGFRYRIYGEDFTHNVLRFPGILDLTVGQNEYVTAGQLNGVVIHFGGVLPVPIPKVDGIYAFGSIDAELNGPVGNGQQLLLTPVPSTANVTYLSPNVYTIPVSQPNRDRYRFGVGIDLYHLLTAKSQKEGPSPSSTNNTQTK